MVRKQPFIGRCASWTLFIGHFVDCLRFIGQSLSLFPRQFSPHHGQEHDSIVAVGIVVIVPNVHIDVIVVVIVVVVIVIVVVAVCVGGEGAGKGQGGGQQNRVVSQKFF